MSKIIISLTNDLVTDQRLKKICDSLQSIGYEITLIGRELPNSLPISRKYKTIRMQLLFKKGFLFYAEYNLRLFFKLLFLKKDVLLANDLDTLLPNYLISKILSKKLVYDSHELFTEVYELITRPKIRMVWLQIEKYVFSRLKNVYTVNDSIANFYHKKYKVPVKVIRNIAPKLSNQSIDLAFADKIKGSNKMLILQGSGINTDRGAEEAIYMMQYLKKTILYIIGGGDVFKELKKLVNELDLSSRVFIKNKMLYDDLMEYTKIADLGLSLDKNTNLNYEYSLPNKVFDYIQAQIPLLVSNRKEVARLVLKNEIGLVVDTHDPKKLATIVKKILSDKKLNIIWKKNLKRSSEKYCWENESNNLLKIYNNLK